MSIDTPSTSTTDGDLDVSTLLRGDQAIVTVVGEVDLANADRLGATLLELGRTGVAHFTIDLSGVPFMDSSGLSALVGLMGRYPHSIVSVVGAQAVVRKVMRITGLDGRITLL